MLKRGPTCHSVPENFPSILIVEAPAKPQPPIIPATLVADPLLLSGFKHASGIEGLTCRCFVGVKPFQGVQ